MYLWDPETRGYEQKLERLPETVRFRIAVGVLERTVSRFDPLIENAAAREFIEVCLLRCRAAIAAGLPLTPVPAGYSAELDVLLEDADETGVKGLLLGLSFCFAEEFETQAAKNTYAILSYCYEADLQRSCTDPIITLEYERHSARCRDMIDYQKSLIDRAVA
ncbi:hypothetical protein [Glycomyces buryatensis]|uniref:Uncharacterized protein n=1 Tax=Glycomyces buryatensis TaxID=2570927 RepID=A0A4S8Q0Z0_9ACTN|nr:hypothetical protein [Glycomyces buryatensis]THV37767.1 hypothetical protein FAB82_20215 [Glycomyces buryatensis]